MKYVSAARLLFRVPAIFIIHMALLVIVAGALTTHFLGVQGNVRLHVGDGPVGSYVVTSGPSDGEFPFSVALEGCEVLCYPGTSYPCDCASTIRLAEQGDTLRGRVSMNNVFSYHGWRFYQTAIGMDSSTLAVSHDPFGIGITYVGYVLLAIGMVAFFFSRNTAWCGAVRRAFAAVVLMATASLPMSAADVYVPRTLQRPLAREFGRMLVYHNGRVRPVHALAVDFVKKVYGSGGYKGLTADQVLTGWLFFYDDWKREPFIKVKDSALRDSLGIDESHAPLTAFFRDGEYVLQPMLADRGNRRAVEVDERLAVVSSVVTGAAFQLFPHQCADGSTLWLSWADRKPLAMDADEWFAVENSLGEMSASVAEGRNVEASEVMHAIAAMQWSFLDGMGDGERAYTKCRYEAEMAYVDYVRLLPVSVVALMAGLVGLVFALGRNPKSSTWIYVPVRVCDVCLFIYMLAAMVLRWVVTGHVPVANGQETMMLMGLLAFGLAVAVPRRLGLAAGALMLVGGLAVAVAAMGAGSPQMGPLLPVLSSPWLSIHVLLIMTAYALTALMAVLSLVGLLAGNGVRLASIANMNRVILVPALFLLAAGIFVGAVWANQSWGRYWGWDPKETCALVTMLIYAVPAHSRSLPFLRRKRPLCIYLLLAFLSVLFTYFGANYLLHGLHSYA